MKKALVIIFLLVGFSAFAQLSVKLPKDTAICAGACVSLSPQITGGQAPYSYTWNGISISTLPTTECPTSTTVFSIVVSDGNAVTSTDTVIVTVNANPFLIIKASKDTLCQNETVVLTASGASSYTWHAWYGTGVIQDTAKFSFPGSGIYTYTVIGKSNMNCVSKTVDQLVVNAVPVFTMVPPVASMCRGNTILVTASGSYSFSWAPASGLSSTTRNFVSVSPSVSTTYTVIHTSPHGCTFFQTFAVTVQNCSNYIKGNIYLDVDTNCIRGNFEPSKKGISIHAVNSTQSDYVGTFADSLGNYKIVVFSDVYRVFLNLNSGIYTVNCPSSYEYTVNLSNPIDTAINKNFALKFIKPGKGMFISIGNTPARPGQLLQYSILYCNNSIDTISGQVKFTHDSLLSYISSTPSQKSYNNPLIIWDYFNILPGECKEINTSFNVPTISNGGFLGKMLKVKCIIEPFMGDVDTTDNVVKYEHQIRGSWDPNMKEVYPAGKDSAGYITINDSILKYTIHFQNTGTDTAFNIIIKDTLTYQYLNTSSVKSGASSHSYDFNITGQVLTWTFNNILLPDSNTNEPQSHGFVTFTVRQKQGNSKGSRIKNKAEIYFDTNPAVITNTAINTITDFVGINEPGYENITVKAYPNPFSNQITFEIRGAEKNSFSLTIYDPLGRTVRKLDKIQSDKFRIDRSGMESGIYLFELRSQGVISGRGKLVVK